MFKSFLIMSLFISFSCWGRTANTTAISQGIVFPTSTSTINFSNGFTNENPVGAHYQEKARVSLMADFGDDSNNSGSGFEAGYANKSIGFAVGHYTRENSDGRTAGAFAFSIAQIAFGFRFEEDFSTLGAVINPDGKFRIGVVTEIDSREDKNSDDDDLDDIDIQAYGIGVAYIGSSFRLALDASQRDINNNSYDDDNEVIMVSPGFGVGSDKLEISITHDTFINLPDNYEVDDNTWFGIAFHGIDFHLAVYNDYVNEWSASLSFFF